MLPNNTQLSGAADRIVIAGLMYAVGKGWIAPDDVKDYAALIVPILAAAYGFYASRNTALAKSAAEIPGTVVVTSSAIANATPNQDNIVSAGDVKVVQK